MKIGLFFVSKSCYCYYYCCL